ncbi:hypothetical protein Q3G72_007370 [Acer saccharum]|nr:hypothetical protein Q3G72_007370 [Acer saccharum]
MLKEAMLETKRKREAEWALAKKQKLEAAKKKSAENRKLIFNRAKQYPKEYEQKENEVIQLKREAKLKGGFYVEPEAKLLFIVPLPKISPMANLIFTTAFLLVLIISSYGTISTEGRRIARAYETSVESGHDHMMINFHRNVSEDGSEFHEPSSSSAGGSVSHSDVQTDMNTDAFRPTEPGHSPGAGHSHGPRTEGILHKFVLMSHDPLRAWISSFNVGEAIAITNSPSPSPLASVDQPTQEHKLEMAQVEAKVVVPESVLKKRKREAEWALAKKQELEAAKKKSAKNRKLIFNRAKQYSKEYE